MNPTLSGIAAIIIFSFGTLLFALGQSIPSFQFAAISFFLGYLSITIFQKCRGRALLSDWRQPLSAYMLVLAGVCGNNIIMLFAFRNGPAFGVNILNYLWPLFIVLFAFYFDRGKTKPHQIIGVLCGFCGMIIIFLPQLFEQDLASFHLGYVLAVIGAIIWALYSTKAKDYNYPAEFLAPVMLIFAVTSAVFHFIFEQTIWPTTQVWLVVIISGLTRFSYVLWDYGVRNGNAVMLSSLAYFTPLLSTLLFLAFGFLPATGNIAFAAMLIILGALIANGQPILKSLLKRRGTHK